MNSSLLRLAPDEHWWPAVAGQIIALVPAMGGASARDLRRVTVLVPSMAYAPLLRSALQNTLRASPHGGAAKEGAGMAFLAPRIVTLEAWTGVEPGAALRQRAELYQVLRDSAWVREGFGGQAGATWALARDVARLSDELTLASCGAAAAFEERWRAAIARNFSARAAAAGAPQAQMVLALWRAGLSADTGAVRLRRVLGERARAAQGPLVWLAPAGAQDWQSAFCQSYAAGGGARALLIESDLHALAQRHPWLAAAWPELAQSAAGGGGARPAPIAERARAFAGAAGPARLPRLHILKTHTLEEEAAAAAGWTIEALRDGCASVALVALDRLTARRVRALLDRAGVLLADEAGWKLSTTSAAAALIRWLDLVAADFAVPDLLDWMQSPFALHGTAGKSAILACIDAALRADGVLGGMQAVRATLRRHGAGPQPCAQPSALLSAPQDAQQTMQQAELLIAQMIELAQAWQRPGSLGRYLGLLDASLDRLGMRAALAADPVGRLVLGAVAQFHEELAGSDLPVDLTQFRAFLAECFEERAAAGSAVSSAVIMTTLAGTRLRPFDAALLIGADADHLPGESPARGLMANSVRRELGLRTGVDHEREQGQDLAALLATTARVAATWRSRRGDEPRPLSPLLERLALLGEVAAGDDMVRRPHWQWHQVAPAVSAPRAPAAPAQLPGRLSAGACQELVACPYRFFALRMLGLRETVRAGPRPEKRDFGEQLHAVLYDFHAQDAGAQEQDDAAAAQPRLRALVDARFAPLLRQRPALLGYRQRLRQLLPGYLAWWRAQRAQGWRWQCGELRLSWPLVLQGGRVVELQGRIDRIDCMSVGAGANDAGRRRLLDYKTRDAAGLRKALKEPGEDVQLPFYALLLERAARQSADEAAYLSVQRPADLREPDAAVVRLVPGPAPLAQQAALLGTRLQQTLERIGAGAPLPANGAEAVCRHCELRSLCRYGFTAAPGRAQERTLVAP